MFNKFKPFLIILISLISLFVIVILGAGTDMIILNPKGPVGEIQKDLIMLSIYYMLAIMIVVLSFFTFIVIKYRKGKNGDYQPNMHGSNKLEIIWTLIPVAIVIALSIPNTQALYELKEAPKATAHKEPIVIHATAVDWKWVFSYPEENVETVNYVNVPTGHPVLFKISAADSMASFWVPELGGQIYGMPGMMNEMYLQADHDGVYDGRNSNFTGEGMAQQKFDFVAMSDDEYNAWVKDAQENEPKLTKEQYEKLLLPGSSDKMTFSSTHLEYVDHGKMGSADYAMKVREKYGVKEKSKHGESDAEMDHDMDHSDMDHSDMDHSDMDMDSSNSHEHAH